MNVAQLQGALDQTRSTTPQRWALIGTSIVSIVAASAGISRASDVGDTWVVFFIAFLAFVVAAEPDEHLGLVVMGLVLLHWVTLGVGVTTPWSMALAGCLHIFHSSVALMAVAPHTAKVHRDVLMRWCGRTLVTASATFGVWLLVVGFERRELPGNVALSALALAILSAAVAGFRSRTLPTG